MADFCKQCSINIFGEDFGELAEITTDEDIAEGKYAIVLCEDCGLTQVLPGGSCIVNCMKKEHKHA